MNNPTVNEIYEALAREAKEHPSCFHAEVVMKPMTRTVTRQPNPEPGFEHLAKFLPVTTEIEHYEVPVLMINGISCNWSVDVVSNAWSRRPHMRDTMIVGLYHTRKRFQQKVDGSYNYKGAAAHLVFETHDIIAKTGTENRRKANRASVACSIRSSD